MYIVCMVYKDVRNEYENVGIYSVASIIFTYYKMLNKKDII